MNSELIEALNQLEEEKGIKKDVLIEAIETALIAAYKRNYNSAENVRVSVDEENGQIHVYSQKTVVDDVINDALEISLEDAQKINVLYETGDVLETEVTPKTFGRIAAQTAKQVIVQRIREAERSVVYDRYIEKENEIITGTVNRVERGSVYLDLGRTEGVIKPSEVIPGERYEQGMRIKVYVLEVRRTSKGPQIITSRSHPGLVRRLFELEVPEIAQNSVVIKSVPREAGQRSKIAVYSENANIDPVGACVGPRGQRIQRVVNELGGERIDVIPWSMDSMEFISNALRPAKVVLVQTNEDDREAKVVVPDSQLSLAIGKEGQNARLAAKLTNFKIDIKSQSQMMDTVFSDEGDDISLDDDVTLDTADIDADPVSGDDMFDLPEDLTF
ncbi:MAG: transcription termination/antitermination protein NusA [Clostridia bacterium]|nr:transcription termination/antitermination protein NusA [Clostridia bacterium]